MLFARGEKLPQKKIGKKIMLVAEMGVRNGRAKTPQESNIHAVVLV
jgi:hypothetical protein